MPASLNFIGKHNLASLHLIMKASGIAVLFLLWCGWLGVNGDNSISENDISQNGLLSKNSKASEWTQEHRAEATQPPSLACQPDIHAVLREMTAVMAEQGAELRNSIKDLDRLRTKFEGSDKEIFALLH